MLTLNPLHRRVLPQAVLDFHQQVSSMVALISEQYKELLMEEDSLSQICSQEQMKSQLMQALIASGRYFTLKKQMEVRRTTSITDGILKHICSHFLLLSSCWWLSKICPFVLQPAVVRIIRNLMQRREPFGDPQELRTFISKLYVCLVDQTYVALNKVNAHTKVYTLNVQAANLHVLCFHRSIQMMLKMTLWMRSTWALLSCSILPERLRLLGIISWLFSTTRR